MLNFPLRKISEKNINKQVDTLNSLKLSNKTNELKQIEKIFPQSLLNDLIIDKLNEII